MNIYIYIYIYKYKFSYVSHFPHDKEKFQCIYNFKINTNKWIKWMNMNTQ